MTKWNYSDMEMFLRRFSCFRNYENMVNGPCGRGEPSGSVPLPYARRRGDDRLKGSAVTADLAVGAVMKIRNFLIGRLVLLFWSVDAEAQAPYFDAKTIRFIVRYSAAFWVAPAIFLDLVTSSAYFGGAQITLI